MKILAGLGMEQMTKQIAERLASIFSYPDCLGQIECFRFSDGEIKPTIKCSVRGENVYLVQSTFSHEQIIALLLTINALKLSSAKQINIIMPYFGYSRQERKSEGRVPISARLFAELIETAGADHVICVDLHADAIQGFFSIPTDHVYGSMVIIPRFRQFLAGLDYDNLIVIAPDHGAVVRNSFYARKLGIPRITFFSKANRGANQKTFTPHIEGGVPMGSTCLLFDDMIDTGGTVVQAADICFDLGASAVFVAATHAILSGSAIERLTKSRITKIFVTDSIPHAFEPPFAQKIEVISLTELLADVIDCSERHESVSELFERI